MPWMVNNEPSVCLVSRKQLAEARARSFSRRLDATTLAGSSASSPEHGYDPKLVPLPPSPPPRLNDVPHAVNS